MIKNGKYEYLDFGSHKELFKNLFTEFYGEEYRDVISKRIDSIIYFPYTDPEDVYEYYNQSMNLVSDEIIQEFKKLMGISKITSEMAELLWDKKTMSSPLVSAINEGYHLETMKVDNEDTRDKIVSFREKAYEVFDLHDDNKFEVLKEIVRIFNSAKRIVMECHDCEIMRDIKKYQQNKLTSLQGFLTKLAKMGVPFTDYDYEIITKNDFDMVDAEGLDCNHILFNHSVNNRGLAYYFTPECDNKLLNNEDMYEVAGILQKRLKFWALSLEEEENPFTYVSVDEVMGQDYSLDLYDFISRMRIELSILEKNHPEYNYINLLAGAIEGVRESACEELYSGCQFAKNINKMHEGSVYDPLEFKWVTYLKNEDNKIDKPTNYIYFRESSNYNLEGLLRNLIHEINHVVRRSVPYKDKSGEFAVERIGINVSGKTVNSDGVIDGRKYSWNSSIMDIEENINEHLSLEILQLYWDKYTENIFEDNDLPSLNKVKDYSTMYQYWDFIVKDFYNEYKEEIKKYPLDNSFNIFYENDRPAFSEKEAKENYAKIRFRRIVTPNYFSEEGVVSYLKMALLSELIKTFKEKVLPVINRKYISIADFQDEKSKDFCSLPLETRELIEGIKYQAKEIYTSMLEDELVAKEYREKLKSGEMESGFRPALKETVADKIKSITDRKSKLVNNFSEFVNFKKSKKTYEDINELEIIDLNEEVPNIEDINEKNF